MALTPVCPISKVEKILLSTDCSEFSDGAIREAIKLASRCSSRLYAMAVVSSNPDYETISPQDFDEMENRVLAHLESIKKTAKDSGVVCDVILSHGEIPHEDIVEQAKRLQIDIIVIGRRGYKGLMKMLMGEVAANVIGNAPCKVLVVPRAASIEGTKVLIATDGSRHSAAAASEGIGIAKRLGSSVIVLSSVRNSTDKEELSEAASNIDIVRGMANKEDVSLEALTPGGRSYEVIVETASSRCVDLIVVGSYGKTGIKKLLMGSSTEKVIGQASCAVLVVRAEDEK
jgi:hypothetical protein